MKFIEIDMKSCTCYYFDYKIKFENFNFDSILLDEKNHTEIF